MKRSQLLRSHAMPVLFAVWLWSIFIARWITIDVSEGGDKITMFAALSWPLLLYVFVPSFRRTLSSESIIKHRAFFIWLAVYAAINVVSSLASIDPFRSGPYFAAMVVSLVMAFSFNLVLDEKQFIEALITFSLIGSAILLFYVSVGKTAVDGRLAGTWNPVQLGVIAFAVAATALLSRNPAMIGICALPPLITLVLSNTRSSAIALVLAVILWAAFRGRLAPNLATVTYATCLGTIFVIVVASRQEWLATVLRGIADFLQVDDPQRGLGTGATGRWDVWKETWYLFLAHPVIGVGYQMHQMHISVKWAHNGYLSTMAEGGVLGTLPVGYFVMRSLRRWASYADRPWMSWVVGFLVGYLFIACFEAILLSIALPTTVIALVLFVRGYLFPPAVPRVVTAAERLWGQSAPGPSPVASSSGGGGS